MQDDTFTGVTPQTVGRSMWRIENKIPCKFDAFTNKLHEGDCYLVLDSVKSATSTSVEHKIHFWLGNECSVDEKGIVAYKAVELDDKLNGLARQIRETQGNESDEFLAYFKSYGGIEYLPGGVESGFKHVEKDVYPTRLLHVKGKRVCRVKSVEVSSTSLNKGDAFVLDKGLMIYVFFGSDCNKYEQIKAMESKSTLHLILRLLLFIFYYHQSNDDSTNHCLRFARFLFIYSSLPHFAPCLLPYNHFNNLKLFVKSMMMNAEHVVKSFV